MIFQACPSEVTPFFFLFNTLKLLIWSQHLIWADFSANLWCNLMSVCVIHWLSSAGVEEFQESALNTQIKDNLLQKKRTLKQTSRLR